MQIIKGFPNPLGLTIQENIANFALFSSASEKVTLGLFRDTELLEEIPLNRTEDIWHIGILDLEEGLNYAFQCHFEEGRVCDPATWLIDPYAKIVVEGKALAKIPDPFHWGEDAPLQIKREDLIIYEMHVRGFTKHSSSKVEHPGTYLGLIEKIPYLKKLGVNAVELMPVYGFDQNRMKKVNPVTKKKLVNYWGYSPLHYFAPMDWYAVKDPVTEFKTMVRELHKNGIEVILDVVYNHTGEEGYESYCVNFCGIDNPVYYMTSEEGKYLNFTGCHNTFNVNHPIVQKFILDSMRYWIEEMHVDGFRFDLASIFSRDQNGQPLEHPPILEAMRKDPIINQVKLIAEAWDAAGLYQLGFFPKFGPWSEWNGRYRDIVRRFLKGTDGKAGNFASAVSGCQMIYSSSNTPLSSINFITAHDGFTLRDLVTYQNKHNHENGEGNRDGNNQNDNWNCGHEGPTKDPEIIRLREKQMRNFLLALFISQGIPMLLMGDEYGHTRKGNNNPYVQDNELNWFLWDKVDEKMFNFVSFLISFREKHPTLKHTEFLTEADVDWLNNWDHETRQVSYLLKGDPSLFIAFNSYFEPATRDLPEGEWKVIINTDDDWTFNSQTVVTKLELPPYTAVLLIRH